MYRCVLCARACTHTCRHTHIHTVHYQVGWIKASLRVEKAQKRQAFCQQMKKDTVDLLPSQPEPVLLGWISLAEIGQNFKHWWHPEGGGCTDIVCLHMASEELHVCLLEVHVCFGSSRKNKEREGTTPCFSGCQWQAVSKWERSLLDYLVIRVLK